MEKEFAIPGINEIASNINSLQKENIDIMMTMMKDVFGEKNFLKSLSGDVSEKKLNGGFAEFFDIAEKMFQDMVEISNIIIPAFFRYSKNTSSLLTGNMPESPAQIMQNLMEGLALTDAWSCKEKINVILDKLEVYNATVIEFLSFTLIPMEEKARKAMTEIMSSTGSVKSPEEAREVYKKWLKFMEDECRNHFKTDYYKNLVAKIFTVMDEYRSASRELVLELIHLSGLPVEYEKDEPGRTVKTPNFGKKEGKQPENIEEVQKVKTA